MAIANNLQKVIEVVHTGVCDAGGSNSVPVQNVYHFERTTTVAVISKAGVFTAWKAAIGDKVILALNERYTSQNVTIRCVNDAEERFSTHTFTDPGAVTGDSLPVKEAATLILRSDTRGPWAKGSKHYGPISESDIGDDVLNAGALVLWGAVRTGILNGFTDALGNVWKSTILSKFYSNFATNPTTLFTYPVTEVLINKNLGVMRGRKITTVR